MKTVRTVTRVVEKTETIRHRPRFGLGDYMQVYYGEYENHNFWIKDIRYNHDRGCFQYLYGGGIMGGWMAEDQIVLIEKAQVAA